MSPYERITDWTTLISARLTCSALPCWDSRDFHRRTQYAGPRTVRP